VCELLVGLPDVDVLCVDDTTDEALRVHVSARTRRPGCPGCDGVVRRKDSDPVELVDLPAFGSAARLVLHKQRWNALRIVSRGVVH
jgi:transposase